MKTMWLTAWVVVSVGAQSYAATEQTNAGSAAPAAIELTEAEQAWIKAHPQVRWGGAPDWPPFSTLNSSGQFVGIDADITQLVAERAGLHLTVVPSKSWPDMIAKAQAGEVDFLSGIARVPDRLETFDYTRHYCAFPVVLIMRQDAPFLMLTRHVPTLKVAVPRDHATTLQLQRDYPTKHFILTDTSEEAVRLVAVGKADATVQNLAAATRAIHLNGLTNLKIVGVTRYEFPLRFAVRKDAPELTSILNKALDTLSADEQERIYVAHLVPAVAKARDWGAWRRRTFYTLIAGAVIAGSFILWNRYLARQIRRRETVETDLRETQARLERRTQQLNRRVQEAERLNHDLQSANRDLERFTGSVSHDLRAPLRRMIAFAELLQAEAGDRLAGEPAQWMSVIVKESRSMDRLIHDLLEFARLGRAELHKEPVNMRRLVENTVADFQPQLHDRHVDWKIGDLCKVDGDPNLLHAAMANLIDNALKYTRRIPETQIQVDVLPDGPANHETVFYVRDNGCGFDMNQAGKLFDPFQRLHSSKDYEGTGIGLANVQRIIQKHGGRIWFESEPNKGATFYFTLACVA